MLYFVVTTPLVFSLLKRRGRRARGNLHTPTIRSIKHVIFVVRFVSEVLNDFARILVRAKHW